MVTPCSRRAAVRRGTAVSATARSMSTVSAALHTLGLRVLALIRICSAMSRSAAACT
ncbi:Uncharacterised protein [Mycobacteroides abscessus subsp. abscessus]|nr:Uncharacterised protein [Mycobacteroides abscessus subsp. abscessus]